MLGIQLGIQEREALSYPTHLIKVKKVQKSNPTLLSQKYNSTPISDQKNIICLNALVPVFRLYDAM